jgi:asparagine synthase (glutamine-hydrolysing)
VNVDVRLKSSFLFVSHTTPCKTLAVKGYCFYENTFFSSGSFLHLVDKYSDTPDQFEFFLRSIEGLYQIVVELEDLLLFSVDTMRSLPLLYGSNANCFVVSDDANYVRQYLGLSVYKTDCIEEFITTLFVAGNDSLIEGLYQLEAGQYAVFDKSSAKLSLKFYHYYMASDTRYLDKAEVFEQAKIIEEQAFSRLIDSLEGRTAIVPLSGGYDSRYVVSMLKKFEYEHVICFTYGKKGSFEVEISKQVSEKLRFKWIFVEYTDDLIAELFSSSQFHDYHKYASNYTSLAHFQDYLAVKYLHEYKLIPSDSVFIPGHSGDLLGGSHIRAVYSQFLYEGFSDVFNIYKVLSENWYRENVLNEGRLNQAYCNEKIRAFFKDLSASELGQIPYLTDCWNIANRQAKFIVNSCRVYDFFGYDFRLPLWDRELALFWQSLPLNYKINVSCNIYDEYLLTQVFSRFDVAISKSNVSSNLKSFLKKHCRSFIVPLFERTPFLNRLLHKTENLNGFREMVQHMSLDLAYKKDTSNVHIANFSALWFLEKVLGFSYQKKS